MACGKTLPRKQESPAQGGAFSWKPSRVTGLHGRYVDCRWTFLTLLDVEAHFLTFVECFVTLASDCGVVNEYVLAAIFRSDEAETFRRVEPLNCTSTQDNTLYQKNNNMDKPSESWSFFYFPAPLTGRVSYNDHSRTEFAAGR